MSIENEVQTAPVVTEQVAAPAEITEPTAAESKATEDAAMQEGFDAAQGIEKPEPEPEPELPKFAGYTEDEVKKAFATIAALEQRESKVFGSLGSLKQGLDNLRSSQVSQPAQSLNISKVTFKRVAAEFPEIADMLAEDFNEAITTSSAPDPKQNAQIESLKTRLDESSQAAETRFLTLMHPDWRAVCKTDDFGTWKESLPAYTKAELDASWDAEFIAGKLSEFKDWKDKSAQTKQTNQRRLEAAVTPKSAATVRPAPSENDAFIAGWKSVRG